jgi:branched-chain amino acid aminotransferase
MFHFKDYTGRYCIINNQTEEADELKTISLTSSSVGYEVIRVVDGVFLFMEDHLKRLNGSVQKRNKIYNIDFEDLKKVLLKLQVNNELISGNVKLIISLADDEITAPLIIAYQVFHSYPDEGEYLNGIKTSLFYMERENPNIKFMNAYVQDKCREEIVSRKVFEVLLVDHDGYVTEGSKSNIFLIREGSLFTPPANLVLKGITREKVMAISKETNYRLSEENIAIDSLHMFDAAFITGTSPKVLPVASVDSIAFDPKHPLIGNIKARYDALISDYVLKVKRIGYNIDPCLQE